MVGKTLTLLYCIGVCGRHTKTYTVSDCVEGTQRPYTVSDSVEGTQRPYTVSDSVEGTQRPYTVSDSVEGTLRTYGIRLLPYRILWKAH